MCPAAKSCRRRYGRRAAAQCWRGCDRGGQVGKRRQVGHGRCALDWRCSAQCRGRHAGSAGERLRRWSGPKRWRGSCPNHSRTGQGAGTCCSNRTRCLNPLASWCHHPSHCDQWCARSNHMVAQSMSLWTKIPHDPARRYTARLLPRSRCAKPVQCWVCVYCCHLWWPWSLLRETRHCLSWPLSLLWERVAAWADHWRSSHGH